MYSVLQIAEFSDWLHGLRDRTTAGDYLAQVAGDGVVGGLSSLAEGGSFQSGFLAAGFSSVFSYNLLGHYVMDGNGIGPSLDAYNVAEQAVTGGIGSVIGGGSFENGAMTGSFRFLFNECAGNPGNCGFGQAVNALGQGAWSVLKGVGYTFNWAAREAGFEGQTAQNDTDTEELAAGGAVAELANHPSIVMQAAQDKALQDSLFQKGESYLTDQQNDYFLAGRYAFGIFTGLTPAAGFGDTMHLLEKGDGLANAVQGGVTGGGN